MKINKKQLVELVSKALENKDVTIESSMKNTEDWDSLSQLSILTELDNVLDGKVTDIKGIANAESVSDIFTILKENSLIE